MREPEPLQQVDRTYVRYKGQKLSYFAGCDYFRLAWHPTVQRAAASGLKKFGLSVSASRLTTGNHKLFAEVEKALTNSSTPPPPCSSATATTPTASSLKPYATKSRTC